MPVRPYYTIRSAPGFEISAYDTAEKALEAAQTMVGDGRAGWVQVIRVVGHAGHAKDGGMIAELAKDVKQETGLRIVEGRFVCGCGKCDSPQWQAWQGDKLIAAHRWRDGLIEELHRRGVRVE